MLFFFAVLQFAELRGSQPPGAEARRFGFRRTRCSAGCVQKERRFAGLDSNSVLAGRRSIRAEAGGASFASLRRAGLRLARLKPVFAILILVCTTTTTTTTTTTPLPNLLCRQLHIPVCYGAEEQFRIHNSKCTICHSEEVVDRRRI